MQFQVPQFIETESKIIGPFGLAGFFIFAAAASVSYLLFHLLVFHLWIILSAAILGLTLFLVIGKVNGRPAPVFLIAVFNYLWEPKIYVFESEKKTPVAPPALELATTAEPSGQISGFKDLLQKITTSSNPIPKRETTFAPALSQQQSEIKERFEVLRKITGEKESARRIDYR